MPRRKFNSIENYNEGRNAQHSYVTRYTDNRAKKFSGQSSPPTQVGDRDDQNWTNMGQGGRRNLLSYTIPPILEMATQPAFQQQDLTSTPKKPPQLFLL
ncbi:hypothetical protein AVEN_165468-1 [Araneus ventricosus]|uniref:Uncharacterized protein n=1 Tax=Araneus ventricosus TaxID=182803 RepID=A0A4Y2HVD8_ARAVE|nr:hypothetical protein AVEN_165468-1 [Araneus ventricosus]